MIKTDYSVELEGSPIILISAATTSLYSSIPMAEYPEQEGDQALIPHPPLPAGL